MFDDGFLSGQIHRHANLVGQPALLDGLQHFFVSEFVGFRRNLPVHFVQVPVLLSDLVEFSLFFRNSGLPEVFLGIFSVAQLLGRHGSDGDFRSRQHRCFTAWLVVRRAF